MLPGACFIPFHPAPLLGTAVVTAPNREEARAQEEDRVQG